MGGSCEGSAVGIVVGIGKGNAPPASAEASAPPSFLGGSFWVPVGFVVGVAVGSGPGGLVLGCWGVLVPCAVMVVSGGGSPSGTTSGPSDLLLRRNTTRAIAQTDARRLLADDPGLVSARGRAARVLLWLTEQDRAIRLIGVG